MFQVLNHANLYPHRGARGGLYVAVFRNDFTFLVEYALCMILATRFTFIVEKTRTFTQKQINHLLLMVSYLVTTETDHHWTWLKMRAKDERTATENISCWMFYPLGKNPEKP